ncbi:MAG: hypothetical protein SOU19_00660 [Candidatus Caccosoma sp.]|nr:hypothetical protein [Candidatus Caccosoma sp.]
MKKGIFLLSTLFASSLTISLASCGVQDNSQSDSSTTQESSSSIEESSSQVTSSDSSSSSETDDSKQTILKLLKDLKTQSYTLSYTINGMSYDDVITDEYFYIGYLNTGSLLLNTISATTKYAYDFRITDSKFVLKGQSFNEEYTLQGQTKLKKYNFLKDLNVLESDIEESDGTYEIYDSTIVEAFTNQLDFSGIDHLELKLNKYDDLIVRLMAFDQVTNKFYCPDAGEITINNIGVSSLTIVDDFIKNYKMPTTTLSGKGDNLFNNVSYVSAIYDFILDDNVAYQIKTTNLDISNNYVRIVDTTTDNVSNSYTFEVEDDKETLNIVGVDGTNSIVKQKTTKKYQDFGFINKDGFELDKFAKLSNDDTYYSYLGDNASNIAYSITQDSQIYEWKVQDIKAIEENGKIVQLDFFTGILQDRTTGKYFYRWINTKVLDTPNNIENIIQKTPSEDDVQINNILSHLNQDNSIFKVTQTDTAWEGTRKIEYTKGNGFYLKKYLVINGDETTSFERLAEGYYEKDGKIYSFTFDENNNVTINKNPSSKSWKEIVGFNISSSVLKLNDNKLTSYGDIINIGSSLAFVDNPLTIDSSSVEFTIENDKIVSLDCAYTGGLENITFTYDEQTLDASLKKALDDKINPSSQDALKTWNDYESDTIILALIKAYGEEFANKVPYLYSEKLKNDKNTFDGYYYNYEEEPYYFIITLNVIDYEYSNEYKAYLLALGYSEASTNVFVKDDIKIEIVNNEDNCEFLHIYKIA